MSYILLTDDDLVKNMKRTTSHKPIANQSWKDYWVYKTGKEWPEKCRIKGCTRSAFGGGHVHIDGYNNFEIFIIPICRSCNNANNTDWMSVNVRTPAAVVEEYVTRTEEESPNYLPVSGELETLATFLMRQWYIKTITNNYYNN